MALDAAEQTRAGVASREVEAYSHGRVPREVRVRHVLALAEELFVERGFTGASMDELARRAGVSKPMIYELVGTKDQVFTACIAHLGTELAEVVFASASIEGDWRERLRAGGLAFFRFVERHRSAWEVLLASGSQPYDEAVREIRGQQHRVVAQLLASAPPDAPDASGHRVTPMAFAELELDALAVAINGAFEAIAAWWASHPEVEAERLAEWFAALVTPGLRDMARDQHLLT